jgi:hypothetical protein
MVTFFSSFILLFALHLTQYPSVAMEAYTVRGKRRFPREMVIAPLAQAYIGEVDSKRRFPREMVVV